MLITDNKGKHEYKDDVHMLFGILTSAQSSCLPYTSNVV